LLISHVASFSRSASADFIAHSSAINSSCQLTANRVSGATSVLCVLTNALLAFRGSHKHFRTFNVAALNLCSRFVIKLFAKTVSCARIPQFRVFDFVADVVRLAVVVAHVAIAIPDSRAVKAV